MKKIILVVAIAFSLSGYSQDNLQEQKDAYTLVELISKPTFKPIIKQFSGMIKAENIEVFEKEIETTFPELFKGLSELYVQEFTHDEIKGLIKFYQSELGKKIASKQGLMAQKGMMLGQNWGMKVQGMMSKYQ